eukprot:CAMPEP_0201659996 /NCGR_PEP_ID=MMETSP0494-20130426/2724_1 /ASSEMBLY_ACC=CAM_ASM_000839 /TAXON_ID=420259 /ORGANISM="Thalassiosira gravida, Strain GMp14c1" /LENGTH=860 /DNA_ID=CAMNT_0048137711 /DNA_START=35 /DNA_END=2617 /DNA_ORIENTATION=-
MPNHNNDRPSHPQLVLSANNANDASSSITDSSDALSNKGADGRGHDVSLATADADLWLDRAAASAAAASINDDTNSVTKNIHPNQTNTTTISRNCALYHQNSNKDLIREEDAYILEQGVEEKRGADIADFDEEGRRLEASKSNGSLTDFENEDVAGTGEEEELDVVKWNGNVDDDDDDDDGPIIVGEVDVNVDDTVDEFRYDLVALYATNSRASPTVHTTPSRNHAISSSSAGTSTSTTTSSNDNFVMPAIAEDSLSFHRSPRQQHNHNSEDNSRPQSHIADIHEPVEQRIEQPSPPNQMSSSFAGHHRRSESFDRRMSESAQFAEAVGESALLLRKIIEEDSCSDFDDDDIDEGENQEDDGGDDVDDDDDVLVDEGEELQVVDGEGEHHFVPSGIPDESKPVCASTELAQISLKEDECYNQPMSQHQRGELLPQLLSATTVEARIVDVPSASAPTSPDPLPHKPKKNIHHTPPCYVDWKFTRQFSSSNLGGGGGSFVYRGIRANPPEITKRGMARGNYAQLHRKAWLEVSDKHHRYGKNLRMYYKHWETAGHPHRMFFDWLDSKGDAAGSPLPNLPEIPRKVLDSDTVLYITDPEISARYALGIVANPADGSGIILDQNGNPIHTGKEGWIFILRDHVLYGSQKVTAPNKGLAGGGSNGASPAAAAAAASKSRQRFHHSSFFGGKAVASAGIFLTNEQGRLTHMYPHSGHYRPGEAHMQRALFFFQQHGVELSSFSVDMQQIFKVSRKLAPKDGDGAAAAKVEKAKCKKGKDKENNATNENGKHSQINGQGKHAPSPPNMKKSKKTDCLHLMDGSEVACFLAHKAIMIEKGVFHQIHKIRKIPNESRSSVCYVVSFVNS